MSQPCGVCWFRSVSVAEQTFHGCTCRLVASDGYGLNTWEWPDSLTQVFKEFSNNNWLQKKMLL